MEEDDPISAILKAMDDTDANDYTIDTSKWSISPGVSINDSSWSVVFDDYNDRSYGVLPIENNPAVYTSHVQREQHDKYPALKKAWEDYISMYNITQGEPPNVD